MGIVPIYCEYQLKDLQTPENLLASLWRKLSHSHDTIAKEVKDLYTKHTRNRTKQKMNEIVSACLAEICKCSIVFVVVDALDECPEDGRVRARFIEELQHILTSTNSTETKVRLLVTSRLTNHVFQDANEIEILASEDDIKLLVRQRIKNGLSDHDEISQSVRQNDILKDNLAATIVERAGNMYSSLKSMSVVADCTDLSCRFLVAKLQLDSLATKTTLRSLREAIRCAPEDLDDLYIAAWNRVNGQNKDSARDAKEALCWLSCSFRQLRMQELRQALATREGDRAIDEESLVNSDHLIRSCAGLVTVDSGSQIVHLVHQTAQEFFRARAGEYFQDAHIRLTRTCLTYLLFDEFSQGPCGTNTVPEDRIGDSIEVRTEDYVKRRIKDRLAETATIDKRLERNPFLDYAAHHWGDHARGKETERALEREILEFLNTPKALASTVQVQYVDAWLGDERWLDSSKHTPIHVVVSFALEHILEALLQTVTDEDLGIEDEAKKTAFHWAVQLGLAVCARSFLAARADIRTQDDYGCTALYKASALGYACIVKMILEHDDGGKLSRREVNAAVLSNRMPIIETYIRAAPVPAERANLMLMESSIFGAPDVIALALSFGADVDVRDRRGYTPLLSAVENGRSPAAEALVASGASTTVLQASGKSLLQVAASSQHIFKERVDLTKIRPGIRLQSRGLLPPHKFYLHLINIADRSHQNFLEYFYYWQENENPDPAANSNLMAAMHEDSEHLGIIRLLLGHGADPMVKTSKGETILHLAVGSAPRIKVLLELAPMLDINAQDNQGRTALHHAAASGDFVTMEVLIASGADVKLRDFEGASTLHYAVTYSACVELAIEKGSSINAVDFRKRTALHYFAIIRGPPQEQEESDQLDVLNQLVEAGVDPDAIDSQGKKASDYRGISSVEPHSFQETPRWIGMQLKERRYVLQATEVCRVLEKSRARAQRIRQFPMSIERDLANSPE